MNDWRLLVHAPADGAWNMAVDEALLAICAGADAPGAVTLRLYGWSPPALSLGRHQAYDSAFDPARLRAAGIDLVRRPTGGRAVLHEHERTYAICGPTGRGPFRGGVLDTYRRIAAALAAGLAALGVDVVAVEPPPAGRSRRASSAACFDLASAHEIATAGRKLVGSAQLRRGAGFLQHGSLPLRADAGRLSVALGAPVDATRFTDLTAACGTEPAVERVDAALVAAFEACFDCRLVRGELSAGERELAARLYSWKYSSLAWTRDGCVGERERRWGPHL